MPDKETVEEITTTEITPAAGATTTETTSKTETLEDWKAEARKWESRSKENLEKSNKLTAELDKSKPETQKIIERLTAIEQENKDLKLNSLKAKVIAKHSLPESALSRLFGTTEEELEKDAAELKELIGTKSTNVKPVRGQGNIPEASAGTGKIKSKADLEAYLNSL